MLANPGVGDDDVTACSRLLILGVALLFVLTPASACRRGGSGGGAAVPTQAETASPAAVAVEPTPQGTTPPEPTATVMATPSPTPTGTAAPDTPTPTPAPRNVGGLMVVDEVWVGVIREPGGLRVRSAPRVEPGNVVGSVAEGTPVNVQGRVLNGQEAEPGKGTTWLIVGPNQYIYAAPGYVERVR